MSRAASSRSSSGAWAYTFMVVLMFVCPIQRIASRGWTLSSTRKVAARRLRYWKHFFVGRPARAKMGFGHRHVAGLEAVFVEAPGAAEPVVLVQGGGYASYASRSPLLTLRVALDCLVRRPGSG